MDAATISEPISSPQAGHDVLRVRGARTHNLQNVDVDIPHRRLVVITGPSGSGKSSLAFDTIFAEGQRQYIESLSTYARQFLSQLERPDVDVVSGLAPVVCIDQRSGGVNPRSTLATSTEIHDYLRLLFARVGEVTCHRCGQPIRQQSSQQIQDALMALAEGTKLMLLAPLVRGRKGQHAEIFEQIRKSGQVRVRVDGQVLDLDAVGPLDGRRPHTIEAIVDRIIIRPGSRTRLAESLELAIKQGEGVVVACYQEPPQSAVQWTDQLFSTLYACPNCQLSVEEIEPRTFSFNSPYGACQACEGLGYRFEFDPDLVAPDWSKSIAGGAIAAWRGVKAATRGRGTRSQETGVRRQKEQVEQLLESQETATDTPLTEMRPGVVEKLVRGDGKDFPGLLTLLEQELATATDAARREQLESFRGHVVCPACGGTRLRPEALGVRIAGNNIADVCGLSIAAAGELFGALADQCGVQNAECGIAAEASAGSISHSELRIPHSKDVAQPILAEVNARLGFLQQVGLEYLTLDRPSDTLSGGELQRVRLATGIGSGLAGICYILDEPSIGLHPRDNQRLIAALRDLLGRDNSLIVVEHDEAMMREADWLIDMGPGAGSRGGRIVAAGRPADVMSDPNSLTGRYLSGAERIEIPAQRRRGTRSRSIVIEGVSTNNLQSVNATFPLGLFIGVTGVSGSGKSSLVNETLVPALVRRLGGGGPKPGPHTALRGANQIDKIIAIDQSPLGRSPRSNPATYSGAFDEIRKVYAATKEARQLGFRASRFSFNVAGGRCEECQGQGQKRLEMNFLPDLFVPCPACEGKRFNRQTLAVRYKGLSIADVLELPIEEAARLFENFPAIHRVLTSLADVGLGYLPLGQSATSLSGGESQRVKLATELAREGTGQTLYLLDEPTTGLHASDIRLLLAVLQRLVDRGNTVIVVEHHTGVLASCDYLIDLGPGGGEHGGRLVAAGTPEELAAIPDNATGHFLREVL